MMQEATILNAVILMSLNVGKYPCEGEVAAVSHNGLEDVGVAALCWDLVWWQILNLVQCSQAVQQNMHGAYQTRVDLMDAAEDQVNSH